MTSQNASDKSTSPTSPAIRYTFTAGDGVKETREHPARDDEHAAQLIADARALGHTDAEIIPTTSLLDGILTSTRGNTKFFDALNAAA